ELPKVVGRHFRLRGNLRKSSQDAAKWQLQSDRRRRRRVDAATGVGARDMTAKHDAFNSGAARKLVAANTKLKAFPSCSDLDIRFKKMARIAAMLRCNSSR
ncbi:MAG: hypothetical protein WA782_01035, partial [Sulfitobacter sp.]